MEVDVYPFAGFQTSVSGCSADQANHRTWMAGSHSSVFPVSGPDRARASTPHQDDVSRSFQGAMGSLPSYSRVTGTLPSPSVRGA